MKLEGLSLFFPCHNEEANVEKLLQDALRIAPQVASRHEIIIIDDGSTDRTADIVNTIRLSDPSVKLVRHAQCQGYGAALKSGFRAAQEPWVFYSDGDLQFDLSDLPKLTERTSQSDIITGYRAVRADPFYRWLNSRIYGLSLNVLIGIHVRDVNCAFKLYRREVFNRIQLKSSGALINAEIFAKAIRAGYTISSVSVSHHPRTAGSPTGAKPKVIFKAMSELWTLWRDMQRPHNVS